MKEHIQVFILCALYIVSLLVEVMYPMGKLGSLLLWSIFMFCVGVYAYRISRDHFLWH
jgi:hypothetical protein